MSVAAVEAVTDELDQLYACALQRAVTGTLSSHPDSRDVHIDSLSITFHGVELLVDTRLELNNGRRYGLIGLNGCGEWHSKSCLYTVCVFGTSAKERNLLVALLCLNF